MTCTKILIWVNSELVKEYLGLSQEWLGERILGYIYKWLAKRILERDQS